MNAGRVALVTGGSSGIGLATAKALAASGLTVYEISRREISTPGVKHLGADVTDEAAVRAAVQSLTDAEGRLDVLVSAAGFGISGAVEFTPLADAERQLDVNFFGTVNVVHAAVPVMRKQGSGRIVMISSVAGAISIPFQTYYSVSKAAIDSFSSGLRNEVRPFGITVCSVRPGDIHTGFTDARRKLPEGDDVYGGRIARSVAGMEKDERGGMAPEKAGECICRIALKKRVKPYYTVGGLYKLFMGLAHALPAPLVSKLVYDLYGK